MAALNALARRTQVEGHQIGVAVDELPLIDPGPDQVDQMVVQRRRVAPERVESLRLPLGQTFHLGDVQRRQA